MIDADERVVLVDAEGRPVGTAEKLRAHREGALHLAFSVFVLDAAGRVLLQRRAASKYHSPGRWSNSACGHPRPGERTADAARRRLVEEMGLDCAVREVGHFVYRADLEGGLVEHERDHLFVARCDEPPRPDPAEVMAWRWVGWEALEAELRAHPERFTAWLGGAMAVVGRAVGTRAA
ncbi:MAG TPA: isopentenyl-diphosphate Delta-isomerase [Gemmatimonadaceae bacterium]|nr:isopentenyl-diphosphate Delta-isomerase [Gemmatimonadaceae bacterium]